MTMDTIGEKKIMRKYLLLSAEEHNWSCIGPGDWKTVSWRIYSDASYKIKIAFQKSWDDMPSFLHDKREPNNYKTKTGVMEKEAFEKLNKLIKTPIWRDSSLRIDACDGEAWSIYYYSPTKEILNSSGKLGYIYGEEVLEKIVSCLPELDDCYCFAPAFVSIDYNE